MQQLSSAINPTGIFRNGTTTKPLYAFRRPRMGGAKAFSRRKKSDIFAGTSSSFKTVGTFVFHYAAFKIQKINSGIFLRRPWLTFMTEVIYTYFSVQILKKKKRNSKRGFVHFGSAAATCRLLFFLHDDEK